MPLQMRTRGLEKVLSRVEGRVDTLKHRMRPAHKAAAIVLDRWVAKNFEAEGKNHEDSSLHWKELSFSTKAQRIKENRLPIRMLRRTNLMFQSFEIGATNEKGFVKNKVPGGYNIIHEGGFPARNIPKRKMFPTIKQGEKIVKPAYEHFIRQQILKAT